MRASLIPWVFLLCLLAVSQAAQADCPNSDNTSTSGTYCSENALTITNGNPGDGSPYPFNITVPVTGSGALSGVVSSVSVTLNGFSHSYPPDAVLLLVSPDGRALTLFGGVCNAGANNLNITLSDSGSDVPPNGSPDSTCTSMTYKPYVNEAFAVSADGTCISSSFGPPAPPSAVCANNPNGSNTFASVFSGAAPGGTWQIYAYNIGSSDTGSVSGGVTLTITTEATQASTTTAVSVASGQAFTTSPGNSNIYTATVTSGGNAVNEGVVQFYDNGTTVGNVVPVDVNGTAVYQASYSTSTPEGSHQITAVYTDNPTTPIYTTSNSDSSPATVFVDNQTTGTPPTFCNPGVITVATDGSTSPYPQHVFVTGLTGGVTGVTLTLNSINNSSGLNNWAVLLVGPDGTSFVPMVSAGGYATPSTGLNLTLSDNAANYLDMGNSNTAPNSSVTYLPTAFSGSFIWPSPAPQSGYNYPYGIGTSTFGSTFASEDLNSSQQTGQKWSLYISDASGDNDTIGGYCLAFQTNNFTATQTSLIASPNPALTGTPVTLTATVTADPASTKLSGALVKFQQQGNPVPLGTATTDGNGNANITFTPASEGIYNVTATYEGQQGFYNQSASSPAKIEIDNPTTVTNNGVNSYSFCNAGPINILPASNTPQQYPSRVLVSGLAGVVSGLTLTLDNVTYSKSADLAMMLSGPQSSNNLLFWGNVGGSGNISGQNFTIADSPTQLPQDTTPLSGSYAPTTYATPNILSFIAPAPSSPNLAAPAGVETLGSQFGSADPNGYWSFYAMEQTASGDTGSLGPYCVNLVITPPALAVTAQHTGAFMQGDTGDVYTMTVTNNGPGSTAGALTLTDTLPGGMTATAMSETANSGGGTGSDWTCTASSATCTRASAMPQGESDTITLTVTVGYGTSTGTNAVTNLVSVSGGGASNNPTAVDQTTITPAPVQVTFGTNPSGLSYTVDDTTYSSQQTLTLTNGSTHTVSVMSPQTSAGVQNTFASWSDGGASSHGITVSSTNGTATYIANFDAAYTTSVSASAAVVSYNTVAQDVALSASVTSAVTVNAGAVTFTVMNNGVALGSAVAGTVVNGAATATFSVPANTAPGSYQIQAQYSGVTSGAVHFTSAGDNSHNLTVNAASQTITFSTPPAVTYASGLTVNLTGDASASSGLAVTYTLLSGGTGTGSITGATLTVTQAGTFLLQASQVGNGNYAAAPSVQATLTVNAAAQTITFATPATVTYTSGLTVNLSGDATVDSGLAVTYTLLSGGTGTGTIAGTTLTVAQAGTFIIQASQAGNANYTAAKPVQATLTVNAATQTITFATPPAVTYTPGLTVNLTGDASASSGLAVTYTAHWRDRYRQHHRNHADRHASRYICDPGKSGGQHELHRRYAGTSHIDGKCRQPDDHIRDSSGNDVHTRIDSEFKRAMQPPVPVWLSRIHSLAGRGTGSIAGTTLTVTQAGTFLIQASQAGNANFTAATPVQATLTVNAGSQTITFATPPAVTYTTGLTVNLSGDATASSGLAVTYTLSGGTRYRQHHWDHIDRYASRYVYHSGESSRQCELHRRYAGTSHIDGECSQPDDHIRNSSGDDVHVRFDREFKRRCNRQFRSGCHVYTHWRERYRQHRWNHVNGQPSRYIRHPGKSGG